MSKYSVVSVYVDRLPPELIVDMKCMLSQSLTYPLGHAHGMGLGRARLAVVWCMELFTSPPPRGGRTIDGRVEATSVGLAHARPNYYNYLMLRICVSIIQLTLVTWH